MTGAEFKKKWARYRGKESSAYQEHFNDLCRRLGHPSPVEVDPSGNDFFCFQKGVIQDAGLLDLADGERPKKGWADVWKKDCFGWEYKGKHKNLEKAYDQLKLYRESLLNPPLLVVCDFDRYIVRTNFNGTVTAAHEFTNDEIDRPENLRILRACFEDPAYLKPQRTTAQVTESLAETIADVARSLQERESVELADARTRAEVTVVQKKNLRIARFLNRIVFCLFAEDTGLLPGRVFSEVAKAGLEDPHFFAERLEALFRGMAKGGSFGVHKIRHFNGHLFEDITVFELTEEEIRKLADASEADWQFIQPGIMGTLFERALDESQRAQLGAHYTSEADITTLVEPVLMQPLRREWAEVKADLVGADVRRRAPNPKSEVRNPKSPGPSHVGSYRARLEGFLKRLSSVSVLDPACGSGNFLYVSLQLLLGLEKEVLAFATQLGFSLQPRVSVQQLKAIEINPYAFELAQASVQIGYLQWRRDNGFDNDRTPVLQNLDGFQNEDALLVPHYHSKAKTLKQAQAGEHREDDSLKFYTERKWPEAEVIVGNPPFLGGKMLRRELGDAYVEALFGSYGSRVRPEADLCCYWFEKAREQIEARKCRRAGLLATQGIRGGANRDTLKRIKETGDIFFAESDRDWILAGANVHVSMVGFDNGKEQERILDGKPVSTVNANLSTAVDATQARPLKSNSQLVFMGDTKGGAFDLPEAEALAMLSEPNPHGLPNSDVLVPWANGLDITRRSRGMWIVNFGTEASVAKAAPYAAPFRLITEHVRDLRLQNNREAYRKYWWRHVEPRPGMLAALSLLPRFLATLALAKHRVFVWLEAPVLPDHQLFAFARSDDYFLGIVHSHVHEVWALRQGTQLETRPRYTPTTCFETFPFPFPDDVRPPEPTPALPPPRPKKPEPDRTWAEMMAAHFYMAKEEPTPYDRSSGRESAHSSSSVGNPSRLTSAATKDDPRAAIAAAAKELNDLRERWLNPPEWTVERVLEFPGSVNGPWARYIVRQDSQDLQDAKTAKAAAPVHPVNPVEDAIGIVRYPRLEPRDAGCAAQLKQRTLTNLYNERPGWLDAAHRNLDAAVAAAYGWPVDLTDEWILERLLALNQERAEAEAQGAKAPRPKTQRAKRADEMI